MSGLLTCVSTDTACSPPLPQFSEHQRSCPYFLSRDLLPTADIVLLPYAYLLDPQTRSAAATGAVTACAHPLRSSCAVAALGLPG